MPTLRTLRRRFERSIFWLVRRYPLIPAALLLATTVYFGLGLRTFSIDATSEALILQHDPDLAYYDRTRRELSSDEYMIVSVQVAPGQSGDWFDPARASTLAELAARLEKIDGVSNVESILTLPLFRSPAAKDATQFERQVKSPTTLKSAEVDRAAARTELTTHELATGNFVSSDARIANLQVFVGEYRAGQLMNQWRAELRDAKEAHEKTGEPLPWLNSRIAELKTLEAQADADRQRYAATAKRERVQKRTDEYKDAKRREIEMQLQWRAHQWMRQRLEEVVVEINAVGPTALNRTLDAVHAGYLACYDYFSARRRGVVMGVERVTQAAQTADRAAGTSYEIRYSGLPYLANEMVDSLAHDMLVFGGASLVLMAACLLLFFRRVRWVLVPTLICSMVVVWMLGFMGLSGTRVTIVTANVVSLLFIIAMAHSIHLIVRLREFQARHPNLTGRANSMLLVFAAIRSLWRPCVYTALTTCAGFASLIPVDISPVVAFGILMTVGVYVALLVSFLAFPVSCQLLGVPGLSRVEGQRETTTSEQTTTPDPLGVRSLKLMADFSIRGRIAIPLIGVALLGVAAVGIVQLSPETRLIDYFHQSSGIHQGIEFIDRNMGGSTHLEVIIDAPKPGFFEQPKNLAVFNEIEAFLAKRPEVGKVLTPMSFIREFDKAFSLLRRRDLRLIALSNDDARKKMLEGLRRDQPQIMRDFISADGTRARLVARVKETGATLNRNQLRRDLESFLRQHPWFAAARGADRLTAHTTGIFVLYANMIHSLIYSQVTSLALVFGGVLVMLAVLFRSVTLAAIGMLPNVVPVAVVLGAMGLAGVPLDIVTVMIASLTMGVGVDGTIHYVARFQREFAQHGDYRRALFASHLSIGRGILYTSLTVIGGVWIMALSEFVPTIYFGLFSGLALLAALLGALTILPAFILLLRPLKSPALMTPPPTTIGATPPSAGGMPA